MPPGFPLNQLEEKSLDIVLDAWQREIVDAHPWEFIRGLIHSDGCRITNWTEKTVAGERKRYEYPRYFFSNKSDDIRKLFTNALDKVGVEWTTLARGSDPFNISIARKASVALMDTYVGTKYYPRTPTWGCRPPQCDAPAPCSSTPKPPEATPP